MRAGPNKAFTLLELLVAVTITLLMAGMMLSVTTSMLGVWKRTQDGFFAAAQAKLALDMVERDLQTAIYRKEGSNNTWLAIDVFNDTNVLINHGWQVQNFMKPNGIVSQRILPPSLGGAGEKLTEARFGVSGAWLRFIGTNVESSGSLPAAISYRIARRPITGTNISATNLADVRYSLFRSAVSVESTFVNGYNVVGSVYGSSSPNSFSPRAAATLTNPHTAGDTLATNVVDFGVWLYVRETSGSLRRIFPETAGDFSHAATDMQLPPDGARYPEVADIMIRILSEEGARLVDAMERGGGAVSRPTEFLTDAEWWWSVVDAHSLVFLRRVQIKGRPL